PLRTSGGLSEDRPAGPHRFRYGPHAPRDGRSVQLSRAAHAAEADPARDERSLLAARCAEPLLVGSSGAQARPVHPEPSAPHARRATAHRRAERLASLGRARRDSAHTLLELPIHWRRARADIALGRAPHARRRVAREQRDAGFPERELVVALLSEHAR